MLSKNKAKILKSLQIKKYRKEYGQFVVEGAKSVEELLHSSFKTDTLVLTQEFYQQHQQLVDSSKAELFIEKEEVLIEIGSFASNSAALAVAQMKPNNKLIQDGAEELILALDEVKDPGNLGTIIRIADWYGISKIICSEGTAEFYNPKVISATMGSFCRVELYYCDLLSYVKEFNGISYGAFLEGENVHSLSFSKGGLLVIGNESNGVHADISKIIKKKITIPSYGKAESLNVGVATAVILDNMRRS